MRQIIEVVITMERVRESDFAEFYNDRSNLRLSFQDYGKSHMDLSSAKRYTLRLQRQVFLAESNARVVTRRCNMGHEI